VRAIPALVIAGALVASLGGCAAATTTANCVPKFASGESSSLVTATGAIGKSPTVEFPTPLVAESVQSTVLEAGKGTPVLAGDVVDMQLAVYLGDTGELLTQTSYDPLQPVRRPVGGDDVLGDLVQCAATNGRVASVMTAGDVFSETQLSSANLDAKKTLVIVADVQQRFPGRAWGQDQVAQDGMPAIVLATNGQPGFTVPATDPPTELQISVLKQGDGTVVKKGDSIAIQNSGLVWGGTGTFTSTWDSGVPISVVAADIADNAAGVPSGLEKALVGQKVGSQVLVVIPPKDGYPEGQAPDGVAADSTIIFVVDILAIL
jgi:FKBP-type peptidyl-prolyl cis-trans isomerase